MSAVKRVTESSSQPLSPPPSQNDKVGEVARERITLSTSSSSARPLAGAGSSEYPWQAKWEQAVEYLKNDSINVAKIMFNEIWDDALEEREKGAQTLAFSIPIAACRIGMAGTHQYHSQSRADHVNGAIEEFKTIFESKELNTAKRGTYLLLISMLDTLESLTPETDIRKYIDEKRKYCESKISESLPAGPMEEQPESLIELALFAGLAVAGIVLYRRFIM